jgi:hypothetical protein
MPAPDPASPSVLQDAVAAFLKSQGEAVPPGPAAPSRPSAAPPSRDILTAYDEVLEHERKKLQPVVERRSTWRAVLLGGALLGLTGASLWVWLGDPEFLRPVVQGPLAPTSTLMAQRQVIAFALQIEDFRTSAGHLPARLEDLRIAVPPSLSYLPFPDGQFELRIGQGVHARTLRAGAGTEPRFLGGAP